MPNIAKFEVPADDVDRAKRFYQSLLGWRIEPAPVSPGPEAVAAQHHDIVTGDEEEGTVITGGQYRRKASEQIFVHVAVGEIDEVLANVARLGGEVVTPKTEIPTVGLDVVIRDTGGNTIEPWYLEKQ